MKSIRNRLTIWLLSGLGILWLAASAGIYVSVRHSLLKSIDAELAVDSRILRFAARGDDDADDQQRPGRLQDRTPDYDDSDGDAFFQLWQTDGTPSSKSASLGDLDLLFPGSAVRPEPVFSNQIL
ncbi:MAG: hypothetical protein HKN23_06690, partial [Verrucomicrobiales bacterium]|nr:hypothetical protein [Verrucomicrobiales bacterium]